SDAFALSRVRWINEFYWTAGITVHARSRTLLRQQVAHAIKPRYASMQPRRCAQGAGGKCVTIERRVTQANLLTRGDEPHVVLTDNFAATQGMKADLSRNARPGAAA